MRGAVARRQDVLWIFDEHGEPSATNAYLFNGDIADRGRHALEIFLLLLCYQLAEPRAIYINRGNHEQRDLNERPFTAGGGFAWELRAKCARRRPAPRRTTLPHLALPLLFPPTPPHSP